MWQDKLENVTKQFAKDVGASFFSQNMNRGNIALVIKEWTIIVETYAETKDNRTHYFLSVKAPFLAKSNRIQEVFKQSRSLRQSAYEVVNNRDQKKSVLFFNIRNGGSWLGKLFGLSPDLPKGVKELHLLVRSPKHFSLEYLQTCYQYILAEVIFLSSNNAAVPCNLPKVAPDYWMNIVGGP